MDLKIIFSLITSLLLFNSFIYSQPTQQLILNQPITKEIKKGERQKFIVSLDANQFARIEIEQSGFQVSFDIFSPENQREIRVNKPAGNFSPRVGSIISQAPQTFRIEVFVSLLEQDQQGSYKIKLSNVRPKSESDAKIIEGERLYQSIDLSQTLKKNRQMLETAKKSAQLFSEAKDERYLGIVQQYLGQWHTYFLENQEAIGYYEKAISIYRSLNEKRSLAMCYFGKGTSLRYIGEPQLALDSLEKALEIYREINANRLETEVLVGIGGVLTDLGSPEKGLEFFREAEAKGLKSISLERGYALAYFALGDYRRTIEHFKKVESLGGDFPAITLLRNGVIHSKVSEFEQAFNYFEKALELQKKLQNKYLEAMTQTFWGEAEYSRGEIEKALSRFQESLRLRKEIADFQGEALSRFWIAKVEFEKGNLNYSLAEIEKAVDLSEKFRGKISGDELRTSFFASVSEYYQLYIEIPNALNKREYNAVIIEKSFEISERARGRSLLDLLNQSNTEIKQGIDANLLKQEKDTQNQLNELTKNLVAVKRGEAKQVDEKETEILWQQTEARLEKIQAEIRQKNPKTAALLQAVPLSAKEIQGLLDEKTILLEYKLGEKKSFLWFVSKTEIKIFELPKREEINKIGREFYDAVIAKAKKEELSAKLKQILIPQDITNKRVLIVADGILQYLPFPVLVENELISLPSASVLAELRQINMEKNQKTAAIFADPVFEENDTRLSNVAKTKNIVKKSEIEQVLRNTSFLQNLPRLLSSRFEAKDISSLIEKKQSDIFLDFNASRENILAENLANYRILHIATHGLLDISKPQFSGLVFSLFDEKSNSKDGFLNLQEIYNLQLNNELVVLSACQTALGKEIRGEGLIGLTRGFMYAGASRVAASLWQIDDSATSDLMKYFYTAMLKENLKPSEALRKAQLQMISQKRWQNPYYWASFTIQGDWQ